MDVLPLLKRKDYLATAATKKRFVRPGFVLQWRVRKAGEEVPADCARLGLTVTKTIGGAVKRNKVKRRLREAVRRVFPEFAAAGRDYVLIGRTHVLTCAFSELLQDMQYALEQLRK